MAGANPHFKIEDGKLIRTKKTCTECGEGTFMAEHKDRFHCGKCGHLIRK